MERAVIYLAGCGGTEYVNILADDMDEIDGRLYFSYNNKIVAVFKIEEVKGAWLSIKDYKKA